VCRRGGSYGRQASGLGPEKSRAEKAAHAQQDPAPQIKRVLHFARPAAQLATPGHQGWPALPGASPGQFFLYGNGLQAGTRIAEISRRRMRAAPEDTALCGWLFTLQEEALMEPQDLTTWLPGLAVLGLVALGLMFLFVAACEKV
jgi:hypothetical protein